MSSLNADDASDAGNSADVPASGDLVRKEILSDCSLCVIKVGTRVLTDDTGRIDDEQLTHLADEIAVLRSRGIGVVLVSSGAVGAGLSQLELESRPADVASLQAIAAVGQSRLMHRYGRAFQAHGLMTAQVLLTADDLTDRTRYLNVRNTLLRLLELGTVPIVNENDTVAVDELVTKFGDNDRLAALVTNLLRAPLLVILSDIQGLYNGPPDDVQSQVIPTVNTVDDEIMALAIDRASGLSRGGMASKLRAARMVTVAGENAIVASGRDRTTLRQVFAGQSIGTLFLAQGKSVSPRKRWIGFSAQTRGQLVLDRGAVRAVSGQGRSLLAIGVRRVKGDFNKGDVVGLLDEQQREFARGLTNYSTDELQRIRGLTSDEFVDVLGHVPYEEVIHRDNLLVLDTSNPTTPETPST